MSKPVVSVSTLVEGLRSKSLVEVLKSASEFLNHAKSKNCKMISKSPLAVLWDEKLPTNFFKSKMIGESGVTDAYFLSSSTLIIHSLPTSVQDGKIYFPQMSTCSSTATTWAPCRIWTLRSC